jgi:hypothetical protein
MMFLLDSVQRGIHMEDADEQKEDAEKRFLRVLRVIIPACA